MKAEYAKHLRKDWPDKPSQKVLFRLCEQKTKPPNCLGGCRMAQATSGQRDSSAVTVAGLVATGM